MLGIFVYNIGMNDKTVAQMVRETIVDYYKEFIDYQVEKYDDNVHIYRYREHLGFEEFMAFLKETMSKGYE